MKTQLDEKQQEIVRFNDGCALVLGAPGCGKTHILSYRVAMAHQIFKVEYKDMLCLTFTNRASREMKDRIDQVVGDVNGELYEGNLHRFCIRFLYENNLVPIDTGIIDDSEQEEIIGEILNNPQPKGWQVKGITNTASLIFRKENNFPDILCDTQMSNIFQFETNARDYIRYKEENRIIDFDDILLLTYRALMSKDYRQYKNSSYKWIQVDEVQDLSPLQLAIIEKLIADNSPTVVYFGDERQAIYSFLGARHDSIVKIRELAGNNLFTLSNNYRSPMYLLDMLNDYAINQLKVDASLLPKTDNKGFVDDGLMLVPCNSYNQKDVVSTIASNLYIRSQEQQSSIGVLVRTNADADAISDKLNDHRISHIKLSKKDVFKTVDFKTLYSHFSVVVNDTRFSDWARLLYQTKAFDKLSLARMFIKKLRDMGLTPTDLLNYPSSSYFIEFCKSYSEGEIVLFDTETTGLDVFNDDIIQIAAIKMRNGQIVQGSELDIVIELSDGKCIPETLHDGLKNPMVKEYHRRSLGANGDNQYFMTAQQAFEYFVQYVGNAELLGHNVNYDVNILKNNIKRRTSGIDFNVPVFWDTLKMARILDPNLRKHSLESLLEIYRLEGVNSHNAMDDIRATKSLTDYCFGKMDALREEQQSFLSHPEIRTIQARLLKNYLPMYRHTSEKLYSDIVDDEHTFESEFEYIYHEMVERKHIKEIPTFQYIKMLFSKVVVDTKKEVYFNHQLVNHIYEFRTFNEGDLLQNGIINERVFIMTIHKAKGLEFDNVIVYDVTQGRMPSYRSMNNPEDARVLYVAMSRAKTRLYLTYDTRISQFISGNTTVMDHFEEMSPDKVRVLLNLESIRVGSYTK